MVSQYTYSTMEHKAYWILHLSLLAVVIYSRFDAAVISITIIIAIFSNLGTSTSGVSAYSIFNKGCQYLLGDSRPDAIDRQLRGNQNNAGPNQEISISPNRHLEYPSKFINKPCSCGSGIKAKKCCAAKPKKIQQQQQTRQREQHAHDFSQFEVLQ